MSIDTLSLKLAELMEKETEVLNEISRQEENLQKALRSSSWEEMELSINKLSPLSIQMDRLETDRDKIYQKLKIKLNKKEEDGFYSIAMHMEGQTREDCLGCYRKMKIALLRMKSITAGIDQYVRTVGNTSRSVLEELFPHRKGRIYSKNGNAKPVQADPMILNRHL